MRDKNNNSMLSESACEHFTEVMVASVLAETDENQKLLAFKPHTDDNTVVVAAYKPQEVIDLINACYKREASAFSKDTWAQQLGLSVDTVTLCTAEELDAPNRTPFGSECESIRVLLSMATVPQILRNWD